MSSLAILGGIPVRREPFCSPVIIDKHEEKLIKQVLRAKELSRFMGSPSRDIKKLLTMPSLEAEKYNSRYFDFLGGRMVKKFEANFSKKFKIPYAISVNSATSGLVAALGAVGVGPGDEVITTAVSFNATASSILFFNSIPVFVDVEAATCCLDPEEIKKVITRRTKAILIVHLLGNPANMNAIMDIAKKHGLKIVEDCAQAPGAKHKSRYVGTIGDVGVFSFQETKNISTGEGGMVVTKNPEIAKKVRLIRNHGESVPDDTWNKSDLVNLVGMNFRMTELTASLGIAQLAKLNKNNDIRIRNAQFLSEELKGLQGLAMPVFREGAVPHIFAMHYDEQITRVERGKVLAALRAEGIPVGPGYLRTMYANPIFLKKVAYGKKHCPWSCHFYNVKREYKIGACPVAEDLLEKKFIWLYHINRPNKIRDMRDIVRAFKKVFDNIKVLRHRKISMKAEYKW